MRKSITRYDNIEVKVGDIFGSTLQTLTNPVNCVGVMGAGLALEFNVRFPVMAIDYKLRCQSKILKLGKPYVFARKIEPWVLNFPTKHHYREKSDQSIILIGIEHLYKNYKKWGITSLAVPMLGCGLGGLNWKVMGPKLYTELNKFDIPVELYTNNYEQKEYVKEKWEETK